jgi:uncharacterized membrane protein (DUF485 family)
MIDLDYMPAAVGITITIAFVLPFIYSFFVDEFDRRNKQIKDSER